MITPDKLQALKADCRAALALDSEAHVTVSARDVFVLAEDFEHFKGRLEIDDHAPGYDGIIARDETIKALEEENKRLRALAEMNVSDKELQDLKGVCAFIIELIDAGEVTGKKHHDRSFYAKTLAVALEYEQLHAFIEDLRLKLGSLPLPPQEAPNVSE